MLGEEIQEKFKGYMNHLHKLEERVQQAERHLKENDFDPVSCFKNLDEKHQDLFLDQLAHKLKKRKTANFGN